MTLPTQDGYDWPAGCSDERWPVRHESGLIATRFDPDANGYCRHCGRDIVRHYDGRDCEDTRLPPCFACNGTGRDLGVDHAPAMKVEKWPSLDTLELQDPDAYWKAMKAIGEEL